MSVWFPFFLKKKRYLQLILAIVVQLLEYQMVYLNVLALEKGKVNGGVRTTQNDGIYPLEHKNNLEFNRFRSRKEKKRPHVYLDQCVKYNVNLLMQLEVNGPFFLKTKRKNKLKQEIKKEWKCDYLMQNIIL